jgi:hypothetical protein
MGMPIAHEHRWSVDDVWALPDDPHQRYETVDGELLVSPMPRFAHQRAAIECWLIDLDSQLIERWTPDLDRPEICTDRLLWNPPGAAEPLEVDVVALMLAILGSDEASPEGTTVQP